LIVWDNQNGSQAGDITSTNLPIGPKRIRTAWPTGAGTNTHFTPDSGSNYTRVNENPPDGDTSYVQDSNSGDRDSYAFAGNVIPSTDTPSWVTVNTYAKNADAGSINIQGLAYNGSYKLGDSRAAPPAYATQQFPLFVDPSGNPWTAANVNAAEYGVGVV
jgi:hypothetical protein